jgi:hypothetical protein
MALNEERDTWDCLMLKPVEPLVVGKEIWIYYTSLNMQADPATPAYPAEEYLRNNSVGLAKLRLDGFVSLNAGIEPGTVVTRPLTFQGNALFVNAEIAEGGHIKAELRDTSGKSVGPYTLKQCKPVTGNVMEARVTWEGTSAIERPPDRPMRLVFELRKAKLYSFWIK